MKDILKLIENVDPEDSAALDEIDYRVFKFIHGRAVPNRARRYTTSRDALKSIRPEGYTIWCLEGPNPLLTKEKSAAGWHCSLLKEAQWSSPHVDSEFLPTEELAELHAILQAIEYERGE